MTELIAHRGASFDAPENSLQAFGIAIEQGAHRLEFDVQITRDLVPVVLHDATTERIGDRRMEVEYATWDELQRVRLSNGERIPSLAEVIELARGKVELDIEIKTSMPAAVGAIWEVLKKQPLGTDPLLTSFDPSVLLAFHLAGFRGRRGLLIGSKSLNVRQRYYEAWPLSGMQTARATELVIHHVLIHRALKRELQRRGLGLWLWTAMEDEQKPAAQRQALYAKLAQMGPLGIIVGRVAECRAQLGDLLQPASARLDLEGR